MTWNWTAGALGAGIILLAYGAIEDIFWGSAAYIVPGGLLVGWVVDRLERPR